MTIHCCALARHLLVICVMHLLEQDADDMLSCFFIMSTIRVDYTPPLVGGHVPYGPCTVTVCASGADTLLGGTAQVLKLCPLQL